MTQYPELFNLHTHHPLRQGETTVRTCGLHPWHVTPDWQRKINLFFGPLPFPGINTPSILQAIGECGLDRICNSPYDIQLQAFRAQISESEMRQLPMIIHCVKAIDDLLTLKQNTTQPWIWHGFRGKPQQLNTLIKHQFYVSFGLKYNPDSITQCPAERIFLETDDQDQPISPLYQEVATLRHISVQQLTHQIWQNAHALFCI